MEGVYCNAEGEALLTIVMGTCITVYIGRDVNIKAFQLQELCVARWLEGASLSASRKTNWYVMQSVSQFRTL